MGNVYLFEDLFLDTNYQFAKVSILFTIFINSDAVTRSQAQNCSVQYDSLLHYLTNILRSHSAVLFKIGNTENRMGKLESLVKVV